jgi:hypothetical protein
MLQLFNASCHLEQARVGREGVIVEHIDLFVKLGVCSVLVRVLAPDLLSKLVLLVKRLVLRFHDVHLEDGA